MIAGNVYRSCGGLFPGYIFEHGNHNNKVPVFHAGVNGKPIFWLEANMDSKLFKEFAPATEAETKQYFACCAAQTYVEASETINNSYKVF